MASTYSPTLRIELIGTGDQSGLWGDTTNNNLGALLEQAITGIETIPMTDTDYTLSALNGSVDEARNVVIIMTSIGTLTGSRNVYIPAVEKTYTFKNSTTGGQNIVVKTVGGSGYTVPNGQTASLYCDGTNCFPVLTQTPSLQATDITATNLTTTNLTATNLNLGSGTTGTGAYVRQVSPTLTTPTLTTPTLTTATITGGSISGITDLAVADGGTGASDAAGARANLNVPARDGTDATGTWPINTSGTATNATNVVGSGNVACSAIQITAASPTIWMYDNDQQDFAMHVNSNLWYILNQGGGGIMSVDQSGNFTAVGNVTAYSDETIKDNWKPLDADFLEKLVKVKSGTYDRTDMDNKRQAGVSAQDIQQILPEVVQGLQDDKLSLAYGNLAVVTCVELAKRVLALETEVKALKGE